MVLRGYPEEEIKKVEAETTVPEINQSTEPIIKYVYVPVPPQNNIPYSYQTNNLQLDTHMILLMVLGIVVVGIVAIAIVHKK